MFIRKNINPKGWKTGDCVIRACAYATGMSWDDTYKELFEIGFKKKRLPNDDHVYEKFLMNHDFIYHGQLKDSLGNKMTVKELANHYGVGYAIVIHTRRHLTCVVNGDIYDSWDTSYQTSGYYYIKKIDL